MAEGGQDGREITYGTERITERKSYGTGEARIYAAYKVGATT
jgi:hypothetical protein